MLITHEGRNYDLDIDGAIAGGYANAIKKKVPITPKHFKTGDTIRWRFTNWGNNNWISPYCVVDYDSAICKKINSDEPATMGVYEHGETYPNVDWQILDLNTLTWISETEE